MVAVPAYDHVVIVVMENHDYRQIIGDPANAPYINRLAAAGALLSNYRGIAHPSEPNYLALYAGNTFGIADDGRHKLSGPTLATILQGSGRTFAGYVERQGRSADHNPWELFPEGPGVEKDFATFPKNELGALPTVSFVIPGVQHDMHDGTIQEGDKWLEANIGEYANWATAHNSLLVVTWDEAALDHDNHVPAIFYGAHVAAGIYPAPYDHYNVLSTVLSAFNLSAPKNAGDAPPLKIFQAANGPGKSISKNVDGALVLNSAASPLSIAASGVVSSTGASVDGIDGPSGGEWIVTNDGTITSSEGIGVTLTGGGTLVNGPTRGEAATIRGAAAAVMIEHHPSSVTNSGIITAAGTAIDLRDGGSVTNLATASLLGKQFGVFIAGATGTLANAGKISGTERIGVDFAQGGRLENAAGGSIVGNIAGVFCKGSEVSLTNAGRIGATGAAGVDLEAGARVMNETGGSIAGSAFGVFVAGGAGLVTNHGAISGNDKFGVDLSVGGRVVNGQTASITSAGTGIGVYGGEGTVTNYGTVSGVTAAVRFSNQGNRLVVGPTAVFNGTLVGGASVGNRLELAGGKGAIVGQGAGAGAVTAEGRGWSFSNFDELQFDKGGDWMLGPGPTAQTIINDGAVTINGTIRVSALGGAGVFQLARGAELGVAITSEVTRIRFSGDSRLTLEDPAALGSAGEIAPHRELRLQRFGATDTIMLAGFDASQATLRYDPASGLLTVKSGSRVATIVFEKSDNPGEAAFDATNSGPDRIAITRKRAQ